MQIFKEALRKVGFLPEEQPTTPFEQARKVMGEKGGRKLILGVAEELRENGDSSAIVEEERQRSDSITNRLTLRYDLQKGASLFPTKWVSKEISIVARHTGHIFIEFSSFPNERASLNEGVVFNNIVSKISNRRIPPIKLENMSLEKKFRLAMEYANLIPDFRYGEGEQSLRQKPVKSKSSKRIF